jgi:hypothetical protein
LRTCLQSNGLSAKWQWFLREKVWYVREKAKVEGRKSANLFRKNEKIKKNLVD